MRLPGDESRQIDFRDVFRDGVIDLSFLLECLNSRGQMDESEWRRRRAGCAVETTPRALATVAGRVAVLSGTFPGHEEECSWRDPELFEGVETSSSGVDLGQS